MPQKFQFQLQHQLRFLLEPQPVVDVITRKPLTKVRATQPQPAVDVITRKLLAKARNK